MSNGRAGGLHGKNGGMATPDRGPLEAAGLNAALDDRLTVPWEVQVVAETASTNADLLAAAADDAPAGRVLVAEFQSAGRGRLDRSWTSPAGAGLTFSALVRPEPPLSTWGWLPLLAGLALARAVGGGAAVKWPNDLLLGPELKKAAGILVQTGSGAAIVGIGINVSTAADELPVPTATSLNLEGVELDRAAVLIGFLREFDQVLGQWSEAGGDAVSSGLAAEYRSRCATIGSQIELVEASGQSSGEALDVDGDGRLIVRMAGEVEARAVAVGDVIHARAGS